MEIIQKRKKVRVETYGLAFDYRGDSSGGFSFECNEQGEVFTDQMSEAALDNLRMCLAGDHDVVPQGVRTYAHTYIEPTIGLCDCGEKVYLERFTNTCKCGRDYNSFGQLLAPREQWGEETGEHWTDIINIP